MSFKSMQWVLDQEDVHGSEKFVLFVLAFRDNHDEPHGCWPSFNRMAQDCGIDRSTVIRSLRHLESLGKIKSEKRRDTKGGQSTNYYSFPLVWVVAKSHHLVAPRHRGSGIQHKRVVAPRHPNLKELTVMEPSRSALPILPPEEQRQLQNQFLAKMKQIVSAGGFR